MFWKFGAVTSSINTSLENENVTLDEVIDDQDVLQECKSANGMLVKFLVRDDVFEQLLDHVVREVPEHADTKTRFKRANIACELLSSGVDDIVMRMCEEVHFDRITAMLDHPAPLNPLFGSFYMRIFSCILSTQPPVIFNSVKEDTTILDRLIGHLDTPAIMEAVGRLCTASHLNEGICKWLANDYKMMYKLIALFGQPEDQTRTELLYNAAQILIDLLDIARREKATSPNLAEFLKVMTSEDFLTSLLDNMIKGGRSVREHGSRFLLALLRQRVRGEEEEPAQESEYADHIKEIQPVLRALRTHVEYLDATLRLVPATSLVTSSGFIGAPLGFVCLMAAELVATLLANDDGQIEAEMVQRGTVNHLLDLFFQYPDNNLLHLHVSNIVQTLQSRCSSSSTASPLAVKLFTEYRLLQRIMDGFTANTESQTKPNKPVLGYIGSLITMANYVELMKGSNFEAFGLANDELVQRWNVFAETSLADVNQKWSTIPGGEKPSSCNLSDDEYGDIGSNEEAVNAEIAFARYMLAKYNGGVPDEL
jgi:hypothetical protein